MVRITTGQPGGLERQELSGEERQLLRVALERGLEDTRAEDTEVLVEKLAEYRGEIQVAAEVAKAQMKKSFGGQTTDSDNNFVIDRIYAGYLGFDDWDVALTSLTSGSTANWIHEGQRVDNGGSTLSGTSGDAVTIGNDAVHLVMGIGSFHNSPKINRVKFTLNDTPKTAVTTDEEFRKTDLQIKWLDAPILLSGEDEVLAEVFAGVGGDDDPYLEGVSFVANKEARSLDPANLRDATATNTEEPLSL